MKKYKKILYILIILILSFNNIGYCEYLFKNFENSTLSRWLVTKSLSENDIKDPALIFLQAFNAMGYFCRGFSPRTVNNMLRQSFAETGVRNFIEFSEDPVDFEISKNYVKAKFRVIEGGIIFEITSKDGDIGFKKLEAEARGKFDINSIRIFSDAVRDILDKTGGRIDKITSDIVDETSGQNGVSNWRDVIDIMFFGRVDNSGRFKVNGREYEIRRGDDLSSHDAFIYILTDTRTGYKMLLKLLNRTIDGALSSEAKIHEEAGISGVSVPKLLYYNARFMVMEFIDDAVNIIGEILKDDNDLFYNSALRHFYKACSENGVSAESFTGELLQMDRANIFHGDLYLFNNILISKGRVIFIDFGSATIGDKSFKTSTQFISMLEMFVAKACAEYRGKERSHIDFAKDLIQNLKNMTCRDNISGKSSFLGVSIPGDRLDPKLSDVENIKEFVDIMNDIFKTEDVPEEVLIKNILNKRGRTEWFGSFYDILTGRMDHIQLNINGQSYSFCSEFKSGMSRIVWGVENTVNGNRFVIKSQEKNRDGIFGEAGFHKKAESAGVSVPRLFYANDRFILMDMLDGAIEIHNESLSDNVSWDFSYDKLLRKFHKLCAENGIKARYFAEEVKKIDSAGIYQPDVENFKNIMIWKNKIVFIDFGIAGDLKNVTTAGHLSDSIKEYLVKAINEIGYVKLSDEHIAFAEEVIKYLDHGGDSPAGSFSSRSVIMDDVKNIMDFVVSMEELFARSDGNTNYVQKRWIKDSLLNTALMDSGALDEWTDIIYSMFRDRDISLTINSNGYRYRISQELRQEKGLLWTITNMDNGLKFLLKLQDRFDFLTDMDEGSVYERAALAGMSVPHIFYHGRYLILTEMIRDDSYIENISSADLYSNMIFGWYNFYKNKDLKSEQRDSNLERVRYNNVKKLAVKSASFLKNYKINMRVDVSPALYREDELRRSMRTLAHQIAWYVGFGLDIRYILTHDIHNKARDILSRELDNLTGGNEADIDDVIVNINNGHEGADVLNIELSDIKNIDSVERLDNKQFIVGLKISRAQSGISIPNYTAASSIALALAAVWAGKSNLSKEEYGSILDEIKSMMMDCGAVNNSDRFTEIDIHYMVFGGFNIKYRYAVNFALPHIIKNSIEDSFKYHENMNTLLQFA